jgi:hypothetical protein
MVAQEIHIGSRCESMMRATIWPMVVQSTSFQVPVFKGVIDEMRILRI